MCQRDYAHVQYAWLAGLGRQILQLQGAAVKRVGFGAYRPASRLRPGTCDLPELAYIT